MTTRTEGKMAGSGTRFFAIGVPLLVVGIVLLSSAGIERRSRKGKPYA